MRDIKRGTVRSEHYIVLAFSLISMIFAPTSCKSRPDNSVEAPPRWQVSKDRRALVNALIDTTEPGSEIIFFSSQSFFEDLIKRYGGGEVAITWVVPDRGEISQRKVDDLLGYFKRKSVKDKAVPDEIELKLEEGVARGRIDRLDIRIMNIETFDASEAEGRNISTVFADSTFPFPLYRNEVATPMIRLVLSFSARLVQILSQGGRAYLFDNDRILPPKYRYFSRYIKEILANPGMVGEDVPRAWWLRANGEYLESFFQLEESLEHYLQARAIGGEDPALVYQIAYLQAKTGKDGYAQNLKKCYSLEESFYDGYFEVALVLAKNEQTGRALALLEVARDLKPDDPRPSLISEKITGNTPPSKH